jgi:putative DNA primase/helicase
VMDDFSRQCIDDMEAAINGAEEVTDALITEDAVALAYSRRYNGVRLYDHNRGRWYTWTGSYWRMDDTEIVHSECREIIRSMVVDEEDKVRATAGKASFTSAVERLCRSDRCFAVTSNDFNINHFLLATPGGTVELKTGELRQARPEDHISKITTVAPDFTSECALWENFLVEACGGDLELIRFLQQWCGYCLTGSTKEHALLFVFGPGGNGKSVFINIVASILGDYATSATMETFMVAKYDRHPTEVAMMHGARFVSTSETESSKKWAEARIKLLTGGDKISARFMRQDFFEYRPTFKLTIVGNHKPGISNLDDALKRRFRIVGFNHKPANPDRDLEKKLMVEAPAILAWMIRGCQDWLENGLILPQSVQEQTAAYFEEQDVFGQWLKECCEVDLENRYLTTTFKELFESWTTFLREYGDHEYALSGKAFAEKLGELGLQRDRKANERFYRGVKLKPGNFCEDYD